MPTGLGFKRAVAKKLHSFSGVSHMIDTMIQSHEAVMKQRPAVEQCVSYENFDELSLLCADDPDAIVVAARTAVEKNKVSVLSHIFELASNNSLGLQEPVHKTVGSPGGGGHTLLHIAAALGLMDTCRLLLAKGFTPNAWNESRIATPVHLAASNGHIDCLQLLHDNGGDLNAGVNIEGRSVLHEAVRANASLVVKYLLDQKVTKMSGKFTETPLHTAAELNSVECCELLLTDGVLVDAMREPNKRETALHVAAANGYSQTVRLLLKHGAEPNAKNADLETPLHLAAKELHYSVMKLLLEAGADANSQEKDSRTPLHCAINSAQKGASECLRLLLGVEGASGRGGGAGAGGDNRADMNIADHAGMTPLHLAAVGRKTKRAHILILFGADLCVKNNNGKSVLNFLIRYIPSTLKTIEERLDAGLKVENALSDTNCKIKLDFGCLVPSDKTRSEVGLFSEMLNIQTTDSVYQSRILMHPLVQSYLHLKWNQMKFISYWFIFCQIIYSVIFSVYAVLVFADLCRPPMPSTQSQSLLFDVDCSFSEEDGGPLTVKAWVVLVSWISLIFFTIIYFGRETVFFLHRKNFSEPKTWLDFTSIVCFGLICFHGSIIPPKTMSIWQHQVAAFGVFVRWLVVMLDVTMLPRFGKYIEMFKKVFKTFIGFLVPYFTLVIAFVLSFHIIFPQHPAFHGNLLESMVKVFVMMLGELEYDDIFYPQKRSFMLNMSDEGRVRVDIDEEAVPLVYHVTAYFFIFLFIFIMCIVMMNLLFGLAVADIQKLYKSAKLEQTTMYIRNISLLESLVLSTAVYKRFPSCFQRYLMKSLRGLQGYYNNVKVIQPNNFKDISLPDRIRSNIVETCERLVEQRRPPPPPAETEAFQLEMEAMRTKVDAIHSLLTAFLNKSDPALARRVIASNALLLAHQQGKQPPAPPQPPRRPSTTSLRLMVDEDIDSEAETPPDSAKLQHQQPRFLKQDSSLSTASVATLSRIAEEIVSSPSTASVQMDGDLAAAAYDGGSTCSPTYAPVAWNHQEEYAPAVWNHQEEQFHKLSTVSAPP